MNIETQQLQDLNSEKLSTHKSQFDFLTQTLSKSNIDVNQVIQKLADFQVAIPSWALGAGGTRFGRFSYGGEPASLEQKIDPSIIGKYIDILEENSFIFDYLGFQISYYEHFYFGGNLVDVEISESHMKEFLINEKQNLENLAQEFKKKVIKN